MNTLALAQHSFDRKRLARANKSSLMELLVVIANSVILAIMHSSAGELLAIMHSSLRSVAIAVTPTTTSG
jgi:hypothetical protein